MQQNPSTMVPMKYPYQLKLRSQLVTTCVSFEAKGCQAIEDVRKESRQDAEIVSGGIKAWLPGDSK